MTRGRIASPNISTFYDKRKTIGSPVRLIRTPSLFKKYFSLGRQKSIATPEVKRVLYIPSEGCELSLETCVVGGQLVARLFKGIMERPRQIGSGLLSKCYGSGRVKLEWGWIGSTSGRRLIGVVRVESGRVGRFFNLSRVGLGRAILARTGSI